MALTAGDLPLAAWAVHQGLIVWPTDERLHALALESAARTGQPHHLDQAWARVNEAYRAVKEPLPDGLQAQYQWLREQR